ncbi:MAG: glycosyltransferase [Herminiimonas sp.]|nr:glycosyltransferase [Herminiimonas sp.]
MKPVRLPASATLALPRWGLFALCMAYILAGLIGRDPWKNLEDAAGFGIMWTMANGVLDDWLWPNVVGLPMAQEGPLAFWIGAIFIKLFGWVLGDVLAARLAPVSFFVVGALSVWYTTYLLGRRSEAQPLKLAFGGQPEPRDFGRTLADGALLIYVGCLGLMVHSHCTTAEALYVSLTAFSMYAATRMFESGSVRAASALGLALGLLVLTRGWIAPLGFWLALMILAYVRDKPNVARLTLISLPLALLVASGWLVACELALPFASSPYRSWMDWNLRQLSLPSWDALKYFVKNGIWFGWPAWPFAGWAVYAWRKQFDALHIGLPLAFFIALVLLALLNSYSEEAILLPMLPALAILAAFGLPTMKRGAINAVDWFSVMGLTTLAAVIWLYWIATQTGFPAPLARNALKLVAGFRPEFNLIPFLVATLATVSWVMLVRWRVSRKPSVLWRAVVLSSGGVVLCWLLIMTLWLPWANYKLSYAAVAQQIAIALPPSPQCVDTDVGPAQRASFAYFGAVPFARGQNGMCDFLLLQDNNRSSKDASLIQRSGDQWRLVWEGRRASDRDERFRLYQRMK